MHLERCNDSIWRRYEEDDGPFGVCARATLAVLDALRLVDDDRSLSAGSSHLRLWLGPIDAADPMVVEVLALSDTQYRVSYPMPGRDRIVVDASSVAAAVALVRRAMDESGAWSRA